EQIINFTGIHPSQQLRNAVTQQAEKQKSYKRKHKVKDLAEFNLTKEKLLTDLEFVFDEYGFDKKLEEINIKNTVKTSN
ncbi:MAG: hypothetical protein SAK29_34085, partial [Scytonema sp. PMC 1069.18]|nr:hypothetical protein [Scytonema sp. PMC 1069.18]